MALTWARRDPPRPAAEVTPASPAGDDPLEGLLALVADGDEPAFAELYRRVAPAVFGLVTKVVRDPAQAEEVCQEALLDIWRTDARFDPAKGSALSWIFTVVHRKAVDRVRSAEASSRRDASYHHQNQPVDHDVTAEAVEASFEARRVRSALDTLTTVQREALELAYFGGYTHTEVASMLDLPLGTAKTRIRDGLIRLRDTMGVGA